MKKSAFIKKIAEAVIESIREEHFEIPYLNANRNADLSHVKCLLRWIMPKEYHDEIDKLHEREDPQFVCIINGGQNLIAPNAQQAEQNMQYISFKKAVRMSSFLNLRFRICDKQKK